MYVSECYQVCQVKKVKVGLKLGADAQSSVKQAKLTPAYDKRKRTEHMRAI